MREEDRVHSETAENRGEPRRSNGSRDEAPQAVGQPNYVVIHQQADLVSGQAEAGQELCRAYTVDGVDRFDFFDHNIRDRDVGTEPSVEQPIPIDDRRRNLPIECEPSFGKLEAQALLVDRPEKPGPKPLVPPWYSVVLGVLRVEP